MLSDKDIEKYLYKYQKRQDDFFLLFLVTTAKRLEENSRIQSVDKIFSMSEAFKYTHDINTIKKAQKQLKMDQLDVLRSDLYEIANIVYTEARELYGEESPTLKGNSEMFRLVSGEIELALASLSALIDRPVFVVNGRIYDPVDAYNQATQLALQTKQYSGKLLSMQRAITPILDSRLRYMSNYTNSDGTPLIRDVRAVRMNVLSSIKQVMNEVGNLVKDQVQTDGIELSAHAFPAPDHAPAQGHQFTNEEFDKMQSGEDFVDIQGRSYEGFERNIGQWNCRHYVKPIKIGKTKPEYTDKELQQILDENERGYTTSDGRHYTLYECTQVQRGYERKIRECKERCIVSKAMGDKTTYNLYNGKAKQLLTQYKTFSNACGIPAKMERTRVAQY